MNQVFIRSEQLADKIYDVKLYLPEWKVLFALDGKMDGNGLASFLEIKQDEVDKALNRLQELELAAPHSEEAPVITEDKGEPIESIEIETEPVVEELAEEEVAEEERKEDLGELEEEIVEEEFTLEPSKEEPEEPVEEVEELSLADEQEEKEEGEEDLDRLINDLLQDEAEAGTEETEKQATAESVTEEKDDFDLGEIFQTELDETEQSLDEMLETAEGEEKVEELPEEAEEKIIPPAEKTAQKTILVVDDSVVIRKMVEIALENENYNIVSVANGKDALSYLDAEEPNLVILDIMLPDVNGLDILKAIKASKETPVVMLSAKDTPRETSKAKELGANDFIPKPFKDEELIGKIHELIGE